MLSAASNYVTGILPYLPDFLATRSTYSFDDSPQILKQNEWPVRVGLHVVGKFSREINFHEDQASDVEAVKSVSDSPAKPAPRGMETWGEFGKILGVVFTDTEKSQPAFHHWEQGASGLVAVYRFNVPKSASHYTIHYCCLSDGTRGGGRGGGGRRGGGGSATANPLADTTNTLRKTPGYRGSLFLDPNSGVVLRVTMEAELEQGPLSRAGMAIDYGPVAIADRKYICPLRSLALSEAKDEASSSTFAVATDQYTQVDEILRVNETTFTNYHRLGSTMKILTDSEAPAAAPKP
jgi:hypothetical protein